MSWGKKAEFRHKSASAEQNFASFRDGPREVTFSSKKITSREVYVRDGDSIDLRRKLEDFDGVADVLKALKVSKNHEEEAETTALTMAALTRLQRPSGAFRWGPCLEKALNMSKKEAHLKSDREDDDRVWLTALTLALIKKSDLKGGDAEVRKNAAIKYVKMNCMNHEDVMERAERVLMEEKQSIGNELEMNTEQEEALIELQRPSGAFRWGPPLEKALKMSKNRAGLEADLGDDDEVWLTALCVAYIRLKFGEKKMQFRTKEAIKFIKSNCDNDHEDVMQRAESVVKRKCI